MKVKIGEYLEENLVNMLVDYLSKMQEGNSKIIETSKSTQMGL